MKRDLRQAAPWLLGFLALVVQAVVLWRLMVSPIGLVQGGDMQFYHEWALRIAGGQWTDHHAFYGLPGYAYLLAIFYKLAGSSEAGLRVVLGLQCVLHALTAVLIFLLARRSVPAASRWNFPLSLAASLGWIFFTPAQALGAVLMPTGWLVCAFWFCVLQCVRTERTRTLWPWAGLGLLVGVTATLVATILFVTPLLLVSAWWRAAKRLPALAAILIGVIAGTAPAWVHNAFIAHEPALLSAHGGINFWIGNASGANGYPKIPPGLRTGQQQLLDDSIRLAESAAGRPLTRPEVSRYWSEKAWAEIRHAPLVWVRLLATKLRAFWHTFSYDDLTLVALLRENGVLWPGLGFGAVALFGLAGLLSTDFHARAARWVAAAVLLHMCALLPVFVTERYRLAAVPGLLVLGACAIAWAAAQLQSRAWAKIAAGILFFGLAAVCVYGPRPGGVEISSMEPYNLAISELEAASRDGVSPAVRAQQMEFAAAHLNTAGQLAPENPSLLFAYGRFFTLTGDFHQARIAYERALRHDPHFTDAKVNLALNFLQQKQWKDAARLLASATLEVPADPTPPFLFARASVELGDKAGAQQGITRALRLQPRNPAFLELRAKIEAMPAQPPTEMPEATPAVP